MTGNQEDERLPPQARSREELLRDIFTKYYRPITAFFRNRGFSATESEDLAQETFLRAFRGLSGLRDDTTITQWLFAIASNTWRNEIRHRSALQRSSAGVSPIGLIHSPSESADDSDLEQSRAEEVAANSFSSEKNPLEEVLEGETRRRLSAALRRLPPKNRRVLTLYLQGLKYREIAAVLQISTQTVKAHLYQGKRRLKEEMAEVSSDHENGNPT